MPNRTYMYRYIPPRACPAIKTVIEHQAITWEQVLPDSATRARVIAWSRARGILTADQLVSAVKAGRI